MYLIISYLVFSIFIVHSIRVIQGLEIRIMWITERTASLECFITPKGYLNVDDDMLLKFPSAAFEHFTCFYQTNLLIPLN